MPGAARHRRPIERTAAQPPIHLYVSDGRLDDAVPLHQSLERPGDIAPLSRAQDVHALNLHAPAN